MKKLLFVAMIALAMLPAAFSQENRVMVRVIAPIDLGGNYDTDGSGGDYKADLGFGAGAEAMMYVIEGLQVGVGGQFLLDRGFKDSGVDGKFGFIPVYGVASYGFDLGFLRPYVIGRCGYNFFKGDDALKGSASLKGGLCYSIGAGANISIPDTSIGAFVEAGYAVNRGIVDAASDSDIAFSRFQTCVGLSLSL